MAQGSTHEPTDTTRAIVRELAGFGIAQDRIAQRIEIDGNTLRKHYREELDTGMIEANLEVAKALFAHATGGNVAACIFWMKTRCGWSEKSPPVEVEEPLPMDLSKLTRDELHELTRLYEKMGGQPSGL